MYYTSEFWYLLEHRLLALLLTAQIILSKVCHLHYLQMWSCVISSLKKNSEAEFYTVQKEKYDIEAIQSVLLLSIELQLGNSYSMNFRSAFHIQRNLWAACHTPSVGYQRTIATLESVSAPLERRKIFSKSLFHKAGFKIPLF